jgi:hypothetical protein
LKDSIILLVIFNIGIFAEEPINIDNIKSKYFQAQKDEEAQNTLVKSLNSTRIGYQNTYIEKKNQYALFVSRNTVNESSRPYFVKYKGELDFAEKQLIRVLNQCKVEEAKLKTLTENTNSLRIQYEELKSKTEPKHEIIPEKESKYPKGTKYLIHLMLGEKTTLYVKFYMIVDEQYKIIDVDGNELTFKKNVIEYIEKAE